jgi:hypothetical protein
LTNGNFIRVRAFLIGAGTSQKYPKFNQIHQQKYLETNQAIEQRNTQQLL